MNYLLLIITFCISILFIYVFLKFTSKLGFIDIPNERSSHKNITPRGAGIAFTAAALLSILIIEPTHFFEYIYVYLSIILIFLIGIIDDKIEVSPKLKFLFIFFATILLYQNDIKITYLGDYFGYDLYLNAWLVFPFTFFAITGFTNALNLIDGLDGLAGSISIIILSAFLAIGLQHNDTFIITLASSFIATLLGFLLFNWNPAKIFMGDSGSLVLGFVISILSIKTLEYATPASVLFMMAIPLLDTFIVMTRRIQRGMSPFVADKNHLHHFLYNLKMDVKFTVILLIYIQLAFSIIGYQISDKNNAISLFLIGIMFFIFLNLFDQRLKRRKKKKKSNKRSNKRKKLKEW